MRRTGLADLVKGVLDSGRLVLGSKPDNADVFILCLPTPMTKDHKPDLTFVESGVRSIIPLLKKGDMVVLESTVPPRTTDGMVSGMIGEAGLDPVEDLDLVFAPERVIPGKIIEELRNLDRVMGGLTRKAAERARNLYASFVRGDIVLTDSTTAEFVKLIENSYRDVNIAFANELALLSHYYGINVWKAIGIANRHPRVNIHNPGPGVGGHCIAVDPYFLIDGAPSLSKLLSAARAVNSSMPGEVVALASNMLGGLGGKKIAVLGVAYKGNVGDQRESPSLDIIRLLKEAGAACRAHDPLVDGGNIELASLDNAIEDAELVIIATDHNAFKDIAPGDMERLVSKKNILDTRHILDKTVWEKAGWSVVLLGSA